MCEICDRIKETKAGNNPFLVKELETGYVVIGDFQHFKGYTLFLYKDHVVELFDLDEKTRAKHLYEMTLIAEAVKNAFGAEKMNYECLGNGEGGAHIHWHLFPRRTGDIDNYGNNWDVVRECNDILQKYGLNLFDFMNKIQIKDGEIYWKAIKYYHLLE